MAAVRVLMLVDLVSSYGRAILNGAYRYARETAPLEILRADTMPDPRVAIAATRPDVIVAQVSSQELRAALRATRIPVVNVSNRYPDLGFAQVITDDREVGRAAAMHFAQAGHRRVAFLGIADHQYSRQRQEGLREQACRSGLEFVESPPAAGPVQEVAALAEVLRRSARPVAVLGCNDLRARRLVEGCLAVGLRVPQDVSALGVDNDELLCEAVRPTLSSVVLACDAIGHEAVRTALGLLEGRPVARQTLVRHRGIMVRESSGALAVMDPEVEAAVAWIRAHAAEGIHVQDVLDRSPMSRRSLELRFRQALGTTPAEMIRREQINQAMGLLSAEAMPAKEVARRCGFADAKVFFKCFKRITGMTPTVYRRGVQGRGPARSGPRG